jgi:PAS domain S-box-containing protein
LAVIEEVFKIGLINNVASLGEYFKSELDLVHTKHPKKIADVRGLGFMLGVELFEKCAGLVKEFREKGILVNCTNENVLRILPPLISTKEDIDYFLNVFNEILSVNKSFCDTIGFDREEIISVPIKYLFEKNDLEGFSDSSISTNKNPVADINTEKKLLRKEGKEINVIVKSVSVQDESGKVKHYVMQVLDISEMTKVQIELVDALEKAEESDRLKSAFLAQMSHEIRTPLNVILTSIPLLADEISEKDDELKIILDSVKSAGRRLQRTIDMILSMSSVQSGNYKATFEQFDLVGDLKKMVNEFKSLSEDKGLKLKFTYSKEFIPIKADRYTVNQVFQNLINNAIKYTLKGYVEVYIKDLADDKVKVEIRDSGIGMSQEYLQKMFVPFSQEDVGHKREFEGNGLGLALVKKYIELNRADINVESEKNIGSVFTVTFHNNIAFADVDVANKTLRRQS